MSTSGTVRETYTVLPGAHDNAGGRYECLMSSYVALKLLQTSTSNFMVSNNNSEEFGKFDDVIVEILENGSKIESWAVQLKHSNTKSMITRDLSAAKGKFSLRMYFEDFRQQQHHLTKPVLCTNKNFREGVSFRIEGKPYVLTSFKSTAPCPFNTLEDGSVFQFDIQWETGQGLGDAEEFQNWQKFLKSFRLCANQKSVDEFDREVSRLFIKTLGFVEADSYKSFFEKYWARKPVKDKKEKLYREDIEREVARIVLGPYVRPTIDLKVNSAEESMLKTTISQFDVTLIDAGCGKVIANLWQTSDSDVPLVVAVNEAKVDSIYKVLNILSRKHKFLLVGGDCLNRDKLKNWNVLENLSDLESGDYKTVVGNFSCILQGRKTALLREILTNNEELKSIFKVGDLVRMTDKTTPFVVGDGTVQLPIPYIERSIPKHVFGCDLIKTLVDGDVLVISCSNLNELLEMVNKYKNRTTKVIDISDRDFIIDPIQPNENSISPMILVSNHKTSLSKFHGICCKIEEERNVLNFEFFENSLNLLTSHGKLSKFIKFRKTNTEKTVRDSEILTNFRNKTNVLVGDPGMGKTVCGDFIKLICPFDVWPVKIDLREKFSLFTDNFTSVQDLLAKVLDTSDLIKRRFQNHYNYYKQLMLIWDGLDEVGSENVDSVMDKIKEISRVTRHYQCITSRCHLQEKLESFFNVLSITLTEVSSNDQRTYIEEGLQAVYGGTIRDVTDDIHERVVKNNLKDLLGIPLLLYMFTTICSKPKNYKRIRELSIAQIYGMFVHAKFDNHFAEKVASGENTQFRQMYDGNKAYRMTNYSEAALLTCFDSKFLETIHMNCDDFLTDIRNKGDFIGLITMITDKNRPIFLHKTFAEYFAALYLSKRYKQLGSEILNKLLFQSEYRNIRFLFDMCLSENQPAHQAVLAMDLNKLKEISKENEDMIFWQDEGGRNVLHLVCSYGTKRLPLKPLSCTDFSSRDFNPAKLPFLKTFDPTPLHSFEEENKNYETIVKYLVSLADQKQKPINYTDKIYGLNCVGYADASLSLYAIESLLQLSEVKENFQHFLRNYKDTETLLAYSIVLNYQHLLSSVSDCVSYFELYRETAIFHSCDDFRWETLKTYNILILIIEFGCIDLLRKVLENVENVKLMKNKSYLMDSYTNHVIDPLVWAVKKGNLDIFNLLLQHKPHLTRKYDGNHRNILHIAVELSQENIVKHIVGEKLIDIDIRNKLQDTPLLTACRVGDLNIVKFLIATGAKVDATNSYGRNLLHRACEGGHIETVVYLVQNNKILLEALDFRRYTPLLIAISRCCSDIVEYLLKHGANFKAKTKKGKNLLHLASFAGDLPFIKSLTNEYLIEFDTQDLRGFNPLLGAALGNHFDIVEYLMENGANVQAKNEHKQNILHYACQAGSLPVIKRLTKEDLIKLDTRDVNGFTPLLRAAYEKRFNIVQYLMENGANLKAKTIDHRNILHYACRAGSLPFIKCLTKENLFEFDTQDLNDFNPLFTAAFKNYFDIVDYLMENGGNFQAKTIDQENILHYACRAGKISFIKRLTNKQLVELDTQSKRGFNPLLTAASKNRFDIVEYLLENDANFKANDENGQNLLHYACQAGSLPFIKRLTKVNLIELDTQDLRGFNPLLTAASKKHFNIVQYLLENGANFRAKNKDRWNLLHHACFAGDLPFIKSLTKRHITTLDTQSWNNFSPLLIAACYKYFNIVEYLMENGANFQAENQDGQNLLHYACGADSLPFIKRLTKEILIDLDTQDRRGFNPLLTAASKNRFDIVQYLLENGANFKAKNKDKQDLLHFAAEHGVNIEFFKSCLKGADWNALKRSRSPWKITFEKS